MIEKIIQGKYTLEQVSQAMELMPALWAAKHELKTSNGMPFEFKERRFMRDFFNDMSPLQAFLKPPQIGATETEIVKSMWVAKKLRKDIIYTLPTQSDVNEMAGGKVNRIVAQNPVLKAWVKDHDTVTQKTVGDNIIYYRGTFSNKQAMMVSSQLNIHDEVDASDPTVITQYETRLQGQAGGMRWYFSHPSLAGFGVDIYWQQSDKKEWWIKCGGCGQPQILQWPGNIDRTLRIFICKHCSQPLTDVERTMGHWKNQDGVIWNGKVVGPYAFSGWHASQLMCPWITADAILKAKDDPMKDEQYFHNYVLGLPYVSSDNKIMPEVVLRNVVSTVNEQLPTVVIGVDTGLPVHYVMANKDGFFFARKCPQVSADYDPYVELERHLDRFPNSIIVADQGGDLIGIRKLQAKFPGRVFLCHYRRDRKTQEVTRWGKNEELGSVVVDRNRMMQLVVEQMREPGRYRLNGTKQDWQEVADHFGNMYRVAEPGPFGTEYKWERNGPDHFAHCVLYATVGLDRFSEQAAVIIGDDPLAHLRTGRIFAE